MVDEAGYLSIIERTFKYYHIGIGDWLISVSSLSMHVLSRLVKLSCFISEW